MHLQQTIDELAIEQQLKIIENRINKWDKSGFDPDSLQDQFELYFFDKNVLYENTVYPVGTFSTQALNFVIDLKMKDLQPLLKTLYKSYQSIIRNPKKKLQIEDLKKIDSQIEVIKSYLDSLILFDKRINVNNSLATTYDIYSETPNSDALIRNHASYQMLSYIKIGDALISFFEHMHPFSKHWITELSEKYNHDYAQAFQDYFYNEIPLSISINANTILPTVMFQYTQLESIYHPIKLPDTDKLVFGESLKIKSYLELLQYDYFRALQNEHTIRICSNCKRAFLNTTKHHTIYCDRLAPNENNKTCREVGALNKQKEKVQNSPIHQAYKKCYKKLNQRYNRGTITADEFNELITIIQPLRDDALNGDLSVEELVSKLKKI